MSGRLLPISPRVVSPIVLFVLMLLSACTSAPASAPQTGAEASVAALAPTAGGSLTIGLATEPVSLDPARGLYIAERFALMSLFDTLIAMAPDGTLHPGLAAAWASNADGTEFTFKLRDGVKFHDGAAFDAAAVKAAFDRIQDVKDFSSAKGILEGYKVTEVVDSATVKVTFSTPKPRFLEDLSEPWMGIPSPQAAVKADFAQNPIGTGPFMFKEWVAQDHMTFVRNPDYAWAPEFATNDGPALLDAVVLRFLPEQASRLSALQANEAQVVEDPAAQEAKPLIDDKTFNVMTFTAPGMPSHMMINTEKAPTDDPAVRQALIMAVNQDELAQTAFAGLQTGAHNVLSPTTFGYSMAAAEEYKFDLEGAKALLEKAGWVDSNGDGIREKNGEKLHIVYPAIPAYEEAFMELLAGYLKNAGFEVEISTMDDAGIFEFANAGKHNIVNMGWTSSDPGVLNIVYNSANIAAGSAFARFRNAELDDTLNAAGTELDVEKRRALYAKAQEIIMQNALAIPVHNYDRVMLMAPSVQGWRFDAEGYPYLNEVSLSR